MRQIEQPSHALGFVLSDERPGGERGAIVSNHEDGFVPQRGTDRLERDRAIIRGHHIVGPARRRNEERCQDSESSHGSHSLILRAH